MPYVRRNSRRRLCGRRGAVPDAESDTRIHPRRGRGDLLGRLPPVPAAKERRLEAEPRPATQSLWKDRTMDPVNPPTTTDAGIPASSDEHSLTVGPDGPILLHDHYLIQKMAQFNRERVPERVVHAKGGAAYGSFEVTADVTPFTKARFLGRIGKRTPVFVRFSTVAGELGSPDTN